MLRTALLLSFAVTSIALAESPGPANTGVAELTRASFIGGAGEDEFVSAIVLKDKSILLAGNSPGFTMPGVKATTLARAELGGGGRGKKESEPTSSFLLKLSADGSTATSIAGLENVRMLRADVARGSGAVALLVETYGPLTIGHREYAAGHLVLALSADASRILGAIETRGGEDLAFDSDGSLLVLQGGNLVRYDGNGAEQWRATWKTFGQNRPGGIAVSPVTGVATVVGYGMTHTGREPYKCPFAYGFDRSGRQTWALWNPDPKTLVAKQHGGNGLMADTTGVDAGADDAGNVYLMFRSDGGNNVATRNPHNADEPADPKIFDGVFQKSPGHGFKGASQTSSLFRVDAKTGEVKKGTFMCAWLTPQRANSLFMTAVTGDAKGNAFLVGNSAAGCPTKDPWFVAPEGGYRGGGFLALFDRDLKMKQCGYFTGTKLNAVAYAGDVVVVAGSAQATSKQTDPAKPDAAPIDVPVATYQPLQAEHGGGKNDAWFAVLKVKSAK